ncbi:MAG: carboxypeptidase regulatory-like domain-containing protein [Planctomycetes bacterium]|nr:carboxypeptidase regulatory-like domain-containing protein [Planctomycetota bacterium]
MNTLEKIAVTMGITLSGIVLAAALYMAAGRMFAPSAPPVEQPAEVKAPKAGPSKAPDVERVIPVPQKKTPVPPKTQPKKPSVKNTGEEQPVKQTTPTVQPLQTPPVPVGKCVIKGKFLKDTAPAQDVSVELYMMERTPDGIQPKVIATASSNNEGIFELTGLSLHVGYWVIARKKGVGMASRQMIELTGNDGAVKDLGEMNLDNASIKGTVTNDKQGPESGVTITIEKTINISQTNTRYVQIEKTVTDASGGYVVEPIGEGRYYVRAEKAGYAAISIPLTIPSSSQAFNRNFILRPAHK